MDIHSQTIKLIAIIIKLRLDKFFLSLEPKADSKIDQLNLLRVSVVFLFFYLSLKSVSIILLFP